MKYAIRGGFMPFFDAQEEKIVKELIKDPRKSDNQICKATKVPLKTVNRKRKQLEDKGILNYFTHINHFNGGTGNYNARHMYIIMLREGITRKAFFDSTKGSVFAHKTGIKHILDSHLGEIDGCLALVAILESRLESDLIEIFNADLVPELKKYFGENCIKSVKVITLFHQLRVLHNYLPGLNLEKGKLSHNWPESSIFIE